MAEAAKLLASLSFMCLLLALAAGRRFLVASLPPREREVRAVPSPHAPHPHPDAHPHQVFGTSLLLFFVFGMLQAACTGEVSCGVFVLAFQAACASS